MSDLRELLEGVAEQAKVYDVTDRAVRAAHRRARVRGYAPMAALLVVVLVLAGVWIPLRSSHLAEPVGTSPVAWLPEVVSLPAQAPPVLVAERPVGGGSLLIRVPQLPGTILLTESGRQYTIPDTWGDPAGLAISPDGRWLLLSDDGHLMIQDLHGAARWQLSATNPDHLSWRWSPNGRWLALGPVDTDVSRPAADRQLTIFDLASGESTGEQTLRTRMSTVTVLDSGEVLTIDLPTQSLTILHPSGAARSLELATDGVLRTDEVLMPLTTEVLADGASLFVRAWVKAPAGQETAPWPDDVLVFDIIRGALLRRIELPDPVFRPASSGTDVDSHAFVANVREGILLWHSHLGAKELELMDRETGQLRVVTRLPSDWTGWVLPRGATR